MASPSASSAPSSRLARFVAARRGDYQLIVITLGLALFGLVMIRSASVNLALETTGDPNFYIRRQIVSFVVGLVALAVTQGMNYRLWQRLAAPLFFLTLGLLLLVLLFPAAGLSTKSWTTILGVTFQTSEPAKLSFILFFAAWLERRRDRLTDWVSFLSFGGLIGILTLLIMAQPDFGTLAILVVIAFTMYLVAGMSLAHLGVFVTAGSAAALYYIKEAPYRWARIVSFINPAADAEGAGYHLRNILISVGSGSWWGLGLGNSRQKRLFLPEPHNDSIFAVITEELGFVRAAVVAGVVFYLVWALCRLAATLSDPYARFVTFGVAAWIFCQSLLNIGAMIGLLPLTGVPLPFISFGGTSLVTLLAAVGIVVNISKYRRS